MSQDAKSEVGVLILVLVEHTLGGSLKGTTIVEYCVLILVLVEHTLGEWELKHYQMANKVLILVLV